MVLLYPTTSSAPVWRLMKQASPGGSAAILRSAPSALPRRPTRRSGSFPAASVNGPFEASHQIDSASHHHGKTPMLLDPWGRQRQIVELVALSPGRVGRWMAMLQELSGKWEGNGSRYEESNLDARVALQLSS